MNWRRSRWGALIVVIVLAGIGIPRLHGLWTELARRRAIQRGELPARTIRFPDDGRAYGTIYLRRNGSDADWKKLGEARGNVRIPWNREVKLDLTEQLWNRPPLPPTIWTRMLVKLGIKKSQSQTPPLPNFLPFSLLYPGDIQALEASDDSMARSSWGFLAKMFSLRSLSVSGTPGQFPGGSFDDRLLLLIGSHRDLEVLKIAYSRINGYGFSGFGNSTSLRELWLISTQLTDAGLQQIAGIPSLQSLHIIGEARISRRGLASIGRMGSLETLWLTNCKISDNDLEPLKDMKSLRELSLYGTEIQGYGLKWIAGLPLRCLDLSNTQIDADSLSYVGKIKTLEALYANSTRFGDHGLGYLESLPALHRLLLAQTYIEDEGMPYLGNLKSLELLNLRDARITNEGLRSLAGLTNLKSLNLARTKIDDSGLAYLRALPALETLELGGTSVTANALAGFQSANSILDLSLWNTEVSDEGMKVIGQMKSLERLVLADTRVTDEGVAHLKSLRKLKVLNLGETQVTDDGLKYLRGMRSLQRLNLGLTRVTNDGVRHLRRLKSLEYLNLNMIAIDEKGVEKLQRALKDCSILSEYSK